MKKPFPKFSGRASAALAGILLALLGWFATFHAGGELLIARLIWVLAICAAAYRVFVTGIISRWRATFFIILAWAFILEFKANLIGLSGNAFVTKEIQEVPYCHIAIASSFLNHAYHQYLAMASGTWLKWSSLGWGALLWILITLVLGQAWCSWACFYGGLDTGFARLLAKPKIKWLGIPKFLRDLPIAVLIAAILLSLVAMQPIFCLWACPLKLGTGFLDPNHLTRKIQLTIFAILGIVFIVGIPLLTKKRAFCGLICPFGAWQSFFGRINPFRIAIDPERCTQCQHCTHVCPTFAVDRKTLTRHSVSAACNRCGQCIDACPLGAMDYGFAWGRPGGLFSRIARPMFLMSAWLVGGSVSLLFVPQALLRLWHFLLGAMGMAG